MAQPDKITIYTKKEEKINVISHLFGLILSIFALPILVYKASQHQDSLYLISSVIYGLGLITLYAASTLYHNEKNIKRRAKLNIFDHASIFVLIAATYTPFLCITLHGFIGWLLFIIVWSIAIIGIVLKLFFTGKYEYLSTTMYVIMGWIIVGAIKPLIENLSTNGIFWLVAGGIFYTIGAFIFSLKKIKMNHAIFHFFVLLGSISHFIAIYFYVL